jgi:ribonuclease P protein component
MNTTRTTFDKSERLCSTKIITGLFEDGYIFHTSLFKVVWSTSPVILPFPAQVAFSVTKRGFRLAVTRNLIKRRLREAYRKNKFHLYEFLSPLNKQIVFIVILKGVTIPDYKTIENAVIEMLQRLIILIKDKEKIC